MSEITARVIVNNGQMLLQDPASEGMIAAIEDHNRKIAYANCDRIYDQNSGRIQQYRKKFDMGEYDSAQFCIVVIQVDDEHGGPISELLMPDYDWQPIRDQGLEPIARGITDRQFIHDTIAMFDENAADELDATTDCAVVVIAHSVAKVFIV